GMLGGRLLGAQGCTGANPPLPVRFLEGPDFVGTVFRAPFEGRSVKLTIEAVQCHVSITGQPIPCTAQNVSSGTAFWEYRVTAATEDSQPQPLCPTGSGFALAVPHAWSSGGELIPNSEYFTFACVAKDEGTSQPFFVGGGVIAKCIDWGYPPWATTFPQNVALEYHQLCTRMAVADYCGEGRSNTLDGTPLKFMGPKDAILLDPGGLPATVEGYSLEAVWKVDECGEVRPLCLGKKRWDTLPLEATCVNRSLLIAPRPSRPCESMNLSAYANSTLLVSYSLFIDRSLVMFKDANNGWMTTTAVTVDTALIEGGSSVTGIHLDLDANGVADASGFTAYRKEGPILSPKLPADIRTRMGSLIKPLYRCVNSSGRYLLTDDSQCERISGFALKVINGDQGIEGFVYSSVDVTSTGQRRPLKLWRSLLTPGVYATSTQAQAGFILVRELGYLPSVGQLPARDL
ncbi:ADYC domain-containing protein, partial [Corallococcus carmarthensis]